VGGEGRGGMGEGEGGKDSGKVKGEGVGER